MILHYSIEDDILVIEFNKDKIVRDISLNWNVDIGMTENGIGEIVILDAKKEKFILLKLQQN